MTVPDDLLFGVEFLMTYMDHADYRFAKVNVLGENIRGYFDRVEADFIDASRCGRKGAFNGQIYARVASSVSPGTRNLKALSI